MIQPGVEDVGKEVVINYTYETMNTGFITHFTDEFVYVKRKCDNFPRAFKRKWLTWADKYYYRSQEERMQVM